MSTEQKITPKFQQSCGRFDNTKPVFKSAALVVKFFVFSRKRCDCAYQQF